MPRKSPPATVGQLRERRHGKPNHLGAVRGSSGPPCSFAMGPIFLCLLKVDRVVAASVSEWMSCHSLTLAATPEMKKMRENWHRDGSIKSPGACSGDLYSGDALFLRRRDGDPDRRCVVRRSGRGGFRIGDKRRANDGRGGGRGLSAGNGPGVRRRRLAG